MRTYLVPLLEFWYPKRAEVVCKIFFHIILVGEVVCEIFLLGFLGICKIFQYIIQACLIFSLSLPERLLCIFFRYGDAYQIFHQYFPFGLK